MEHIKDYFKRYPNSDQVFECDGVLFHTNGGAQSYGKGDVTKYTRKQVEASEAPTPDEYDVESATELLNSDVDITTLKHETMKKLCEVLDITTENQKKVTLIKALTEKRELLKAE